MRNLVFYVTLSMSLFCLLVFCKCVFTKICPRHCLKPSQNSPRQLPQMSQTPFRNLPNVSQKAPQNCPKSFKRKHQEDQVVGSPKNTCVQTKDLKQSDLFPNKTCCVNVKKCIKETNDCVVSKQNVTISVRRRKANMFPMVSQQFQRKLTDI